ncbi:TCR gamma alternate reading frame protein [Huso huso]
MLAFVIALLTLLPPYTGADIIQSPMSITKSQRNYAVFKCAVDGVSFKDTVIHWYRHREEKGLEWVSYFKSAEDQKSAAGFENRFSATKKDSSCLFTISGIKDSDAATYYCAYWSTQWNIC